MKRPAAWSTPNSPPVVTDDAAPLYRGRRRLPQVRRKSVDGFPYGIIYFVRDETLTVVAYAHSKRRPNYWQGRLRDL